jgi:hypothetical protein
MSRGWSALLGLVAGLAVLAGVVVVHKLTRDDLDRREHYVIKLTDLNVAAPPGMSREDFVAEVLYNRGLPAKYDRTDPALSSKLQTAFAAHPWVEKATVGDVTSPRPVELVFRTPTLAVGDRVLDRLGVLLPLPTKKDGLPTFRGEVKQSAAPSGQPHGDAKIVAVAKIVGWMHQQAPEIKLQAVELTADGLVLIRADTAKAIWGFSKNDEPPPEQKLARLKAWKGETLDLRKSP